MGPEALALFAVIMLVINVAAVLVVIVVLRSELKRVRKGLADFAGVNARTNMYAQRAIAAQAKQAEAAIERTDSQK